MSQLLKRLEKFALLEINRLLSNLFDGADDWLFEQIDTCRDARLQQEYVDMMRLLRLNRETVEQSFINSISGKFKAICSPYSEPADSETKPQLKDVSFDKLSLVGHDEMDQNVALDSMVSRARGDMDFTLKKLQARLDAAINGVKVTSDNNPLDPKALCEALGQAVSPIGWDVKHDLIFFKLFQRFVLNNYHDLLASCDQLLRQAGLLTELSDTDLLQAARIGVTRFTGGKKPQSASRSAEEVPTEPPHAAQAGLPQRDWGELLSGALASLRQPDAFASGHTVIGSTSPDAPSLPLVDIMALFSQLQNNVPLPDGSAYWQTQQLSEQLNTLMAAREAEQGAARIGEIDSNIINLVSLLFEQVLENDQLPQRVKAEVGRLQIPYIRIAVADPSFLRSNKHPARKLVNELVQAGSTVNHTADEKSDGVFEKIKYVVKSVLNDYQDELSLIETLLAEFQAFIAQERKRADLVAQRMTALEEGKSKTEQAKLDASKALQAIIENKPIPESMASLLDQAWFGYLCWIHHREGKDSPKWDRALLTVQQMLLCLQPVESSEEADSRLGIIDTVLESIREGCNNIAFSELNLKQWLPELEAVFNRNATFTEPESEPLQTDSRLDEFESASVTNVEATNTDKPEADQQREPTPELKPANLAAEKMERLKAPRIPKESPTKVTVLDISKKVPKEEKPALPTLSEDDPGMLQARKLTVGTLLDYINGEERTRCKLAAHIKSVDKLIFVNRMGVKLFEKSLLEIAHDINAGRLSVLEDAQLFDRALESVISSLRNVREKAV